jgi:hypothetical protein
MTLAGIELAECIAYVDRFDLGRVNVCVREGLFCDLTNEVRDLHPFPLERACKVRLVRADD